MKKSKKEQTKNVEKVKITKNKKVLIIISITAILSISLVLLLGYKFIFLSNVKQNGKTNKDMDVSENRSNSDNKSENKSENNKMEKEHIEEESPLKNENKEKANSSTGKSNQTTNGKTNKSDTNDNKTNENKPSDTNNKPNNSTQEKVVCYPASISSSTSTIWKGDNNNVPFTLSNYFAFKDNSHYVDATDICTEYNNSITWSVERDSCPQNTNISQNGSSFSITTTCINSIRLNVLNGLGENIGQINVYATCKPVTGVSAKQTEFYVKANRLFNESGNVEITTGNFVYSGSENCSYPYDPNIEINISDTSIAECRTIGQGVFQCRGKNPGTTTAQVRMWNAQGGASTTITFISQE